MKNLIFTFCFLMFVSNSVFSKTLLSESFNYPAGDSINIHGWTAIPGSFLNRMLISSPGLSFPDYSLSGTGNAVTLNVTGQDAYRNFSENISAQSVYASFMVKVTSAQRAGDYFAAFLPSTSTSLFAGRVHSRFKDGFLEFGLTKSSPNDTNTMNWVSGFLLNTTYVIVLKYTFISGAANDQVSLFVFSASIPLEEPIIPSIGPMSFSGTSADVVNLGRFALRQGTAGRAPGAVTDGILVSDSWFYSYKFYQTNINFDGHIQDNSDWGSFILTHTGFPTSKYLNVSVNTPGITTQWQIQNAVITNTEEPGIIQRTSFDFDIGDAGIDVTGINYGISITDSPQVTAPVITSFASVYDLPRVFHNGINSSPYPVVFIFTAAVPFAGGIGPVQEISVPYEIKGLPNQQCGKMECVPAAISNSLKFLNMKHNLMMDTNKISIDSMKKACGFIDSVKGSPVDWALKKKKYMEDNNFPITTRIMSPEYLDSLRLYELRNNQDVEIGVMSKRVNDTIKYAHVIAVNSIYHRKDGTFDITYSDDADQGDNVTPTYTSSSRYDTLQKKFTSGSLVAFDSGIVSIVIECPNNENASLIMPSDDSNVDPNSLQFSMQCMNCNVPPDSYWLEVADNYLFQNKIIDIRNIPNTGLYSPPPGLLQINKEYFWRVRVNDSAGPGSYDTIFNFTTNTVSVLNLSLLIQARYDASVDLMIQDTVTVYLRNSYSPFNTIDSSKGIINSSGDGQYNFSNANSEINYYLTVRHRNSIETWSASPQSFTGNLLNYDFINSDLQAFGNNLIAVDLIPLRYAIYSGDINQDGTIDASDLSSVDNDALNSVSGYVLTDVTGDYFVDAQDVSIVDNNAYNSVSMIRP
jgi:hypothetical protein